MVDLLRKLSLMVCIFIVLVSLGQSTQATVSVMLDDNLLIKSSRAIIIGEVTSVSCQWNEDDRMIYTYVKINVLEDLKSNLQSQTIVLKQLGGMVNDMEMGIFGAPSFVKGQRLLLFLNTSNDGTLRVAHLFQGKYDISWNDSISRDIKKEVDILSQNNTGDYTYSASLDVFKSKIKQVLSENQSNTTLYQKSNQTIIEIPFEYHDEVNLIEPGFSLQFVTLGRRWFEPDTGQTVYYYVNPDNAPIDGGGIAQVEQALAAWSNVVTASIVLGNGGPTSTRGFRADGVSTISFGDPFDQMPDPIQCVGIVALGGYVRSGDQSRIIGGVNFSQIIEGDVVLNRNFECLLSNSANLAEVICHEIGHTIGLDHSPEDASIMRSFIHGKGRGATLAQDDINAVSFVYPGPKVDPPPIPSIDSAIFVSQVVPQAMIAGKKYLVTLTFMNVGTSKWKSSKGYYLGSQNPQGTATWSTNMVFIEGKVKPNHQIEFSFKVKAPPQPGHYNFQWGMERNGQVFGGLSHNLVIDVVSQ